MIGRLVTRMRPVTLIGIIVGTALVSIWSELGHHPEDAVRFAFVGLFALMSTIVGFIYHSYYLVRNTLPVEERDEEPPASAVFGFLVSYAAGLLFVVMIAVKRVNMPLDYSLLIVATITYVTGLVSGYRLLLHNEKRLRSKLSKVR